MIEEYMKQFGEPIPLMEVMGNEILMGKFHGNADEVYEYCLKVGKPWREVLKENPTYKTGVLY